MSDANYPIYWDSSKWLMDYWVSGFYPMPVYQPEERGYPVCEEIRERDICPLRNLFWMDFYGSDNAVRIFKENLIQDCNDIAFAVNLLDLPFEILKSLFGIETDEMSRGEIVAKEYVDSVIGSYIFSYPCMPGIFSQFGFF